MSPARKMEDSPITTHHRSIPHSTVLIQNTLYLVGKYTRTVLQAHVPTLISGNKFGVWETLPNAPYYSSSPVTIDNTLLTVGGRSSLGGNLTTSIQMYNPTINQWTRVGDIPEPIARSNPCCIILNSELLELNSGYSASILVS